MEMHRRLSRRNHRRGRNRQQGRKNARPMSRERLTRKSRNDRRNIGRKVDRRCPNDCAPAPIRRMSSSSRTRSPIRRMINPRSRRSVMRRTRKSDDGRDRQLVGTSHHRLHDDESRAVGVRANLPKDARQRSVGRIQRRHEDRMRDVRFVQIL